LAQTATEAVSLGDSAVTVTCPRSLSFYRERNEVFQVVAILIGTPTSSPTTATLSAVTGFEFL